MFRTDFLRAVHLQHDLVGEPVGDEVHHNRKTERRHKAIRPAQSLADGEQDAAQKTKQQDGFQ